jgi:hypothetical protein
VLRGIRRTIGTAPDRKSPATADVVTAMLRLCPNTLAGKRDGHCWRWASQARSAAASW